jgi:hypothetical protein
MEHVLNAAAAGLKVMAAKVKFVAITWVDS